MPVTEFARMRRSDHSMRPPMPAATLAFNSPNACNLCHTEQTAEWADYHVRQWRTRDYQGATLRVAALIDAARKRDWTRLPEMLAYITSGERDEIFAVGLIRLLRACADERKWPALVQALKDASPLVRASAAEGLAGYLTPESVSALVAAAADEYRLVRIRAAASLAAVPPGELPDKLRQDLERATEELLAVSRARPDDSASHHNLGNFHAARREYDLALSCYERAFQLLPDNIAPLVNASLVQNALGRNDQAEASLRRALQIEPGSAAANLNLGLLLGEMGRLAEAEAVLRRAFEADPQSATAAYNLAVICGQTNPEAGIDWCRAAAQLQPDEPKYRHALAFYLRRGGDIEAAITTLRTLTDRDVAFADAYTLLGQIYEEARRMADAAELYRRAAANPRFPNGLRQQFAARAARLSPG
jgi:tetratricopeptide (TPR) repeat protein